MSSPTNVNDSNVRESSDATVSLRPDQVEPVIAGTLALMTRFSNHRCCGMAEKISGNLAQLAECEHLSPPFRHLCTNLSREWDGLLVAQYSAMVEAQGGQSALH
jgi:hypothetical protein